MVGAAGILPPLDLTFLWNKELKFEGTAFYGHEDLALLRGPKRVIGGPRRRTFEVALDLLGDTHASLAPLVTHRFPLEAYEKAIDVNLDRREHKSVKAIFEI